MTEREEIMGGLICLLAEVVIAMRTGKACEPNTLAILKEGAKHLAKDLITNTSVSPADMDKAMEKMQGTQQVKKIPDPSTLKSAAEVIDWADKYGIQMHILDRPKGLPAAS